MPSEMHYKTHIDHENFFTPSPALPAVPTAPFFVGTAYWWPFWPLLCELGDKGDYELELIVALVTKLA